MSHCYSTSFSHLVLNGTSTWCLYLIDDQSLNLAHLALYAIALNSSIGLGRWAASDTEDSTLSKTYRVSLHAQNLLSLPLFTAEMCVDLGYEPRFCLLQAAVPVVIPKALELWNPLQLEEETNKFLKDLTVTLNSISLAVVSKLSENYYGIVAAAVFWFNHVMVRSDRDAEEEFLKMPFLDWYTYFFCVFAYLATEAVVQAAEQQK